MKCAKYTCACHYLTTDLIYLKYVLHFSFTQCIFKLVYCKTFVCIYLLLIVKTCKGLLTYPSKIRRLNI